MAAVEQRSVWPASVGMALEMLSLALWLGGLVIIGAVVAPIAFTVSHTTPWLHLTAGQENTLAGAIIGGSLRVFNMLSYVSGFILCVGALLCASKPAFVVRIVSVAASLAIALLLGQLYFPAMDAAQAIGNMTRFDTLHHQYEWLAQVQMLLLIVFTVAYARSFQPSIKRIL